MTNRSERLNELHEKILKKKKTFPTTQNQFSPKNKKRLCISNGATHCRWGLIKRVHGIDSDCNTKAVSLNRFYAVDK